MNNNTKQKKESRQRPVWVDNWLIRERVARWRAKDRVKDWLRRLPRRVAIWVVHLYVGISAIAFTLLLMWGYTHPHLRIVDGPIRGTEAAITPHPLPVFHLNKDVEELRRLVINAKSDSDRRKALEDYLRQNPKMADSLKLLQQLYPGLH